MGEPGKDDYESYRVAIREIRGDHDHWIDTVSARSYEYGLMAIKSVLFVSGGALVAIPAISGITNTFNLNLAAISGFSFAVAVGLSVLSIYAIHLNWLAYFHVAIFERQKAMKLAFEAYLPGQVWPQESSDVLDSRIKRNNTIICITFVIPHLFGILAFISFGYGSLRLYQSVGL